MKVESMARRVRHTGHGQGAPHAPLYISSGEQSHIRVSGIVCEVTEGTGIGGNYKGRAH